MRRITFLLLSLTLPVLSANAQWVKPVPSASAFETGKAFYLYNTEASAFFLGNNDWGTRASYKMSQGFQVKFSESLTEGGAWDGSYYWTDSIEANDYSDRPNLVGQWANVFIQSDGIWVDQASSTATSDNRWTLEQQGDGTYKIGLSEHNNEYNPSQYPDAYIGGIGAKDDTRLYLCDPYAAAEEEVASFMTSWVFVSVDEYKRLLPSFAVYEKAVTLQNSIEKAEKECPGIDLQAEKDIHADTSSTVEVLQSATESVAAKVLDYKVQHSSPASPLDMTSRIANADYSDESGKGWEGTGLGFWNKCVQLFDVPNFDTYQTVTSLYPGVYKLNMQGFYREGTFLQVYNDFRNNQGILHDYAVLYSIVNGDSAVHPVISIAADPSTEPLNSGTDEVQPGGAETAVWYPNMMPTGQIYLAQGHYNENGLYLVVPDGVTSMKIGYRKPATIPTDWSFMDNWSLTYFGKSQESFEYLRDMTLGGLRDYSDLTSAIKYHQPTLQAYLDARESLKSETQPDAIWTKAKALPQLAKVFRENVLAYVLYKTAYEDGNNVVIGGEFAGEDVDVLADYIEFEGADIMLNCPYDTEGIIAETARLKTLIQKAKENGMKPGSDVTSILQSADFKSATGWNNYNCAIGVGLNSFPVCEAFNCDFELSQDVTGIANGIYQFDAYAFYRPGANGTYNGSEEVKAQLFFNSTEHNVKHIMAEPSPTIAYQDGSWMDDFDTGHGFVPNSSNGTSTAYAAGRYHQTLYGLVTDGKIHIGIRSSATTGASRWTTWGQFRLKFHGYDFTDEIIESLEADIIVPAERLLEYKMGQKEYQNLSDAIDAARNETQPRKRFQALCDVGKYMEEAKLSVSNYSLLTEKCQALKSAIDQFQATAIPSAITYASTTADEIEEGIIEGSFSNDDIQAQYDRIADAQSRLRIPKEYINATEENPIDMTQVILNNGYTDGFNSWVGTPPSLLNFNTCEYYTTNYDCYQQLSNLPAGKYAVGLQAYFRYGFSQDDYDAFVADPEANNNGLLYAESQEGNYSQPLLRNSSKADSRSIGGVGDWKLANNLYVPNTLEAASYWFESAMYPNTMNVEVGQDGRLRIGLRKEIVINGDWTAFTGWNLSYFGNPATGIILEKGGTVQSEAAGFYDLSGRYVGNDKSALSKGVYINNSRKYIIK